MNMRGTGYTEGELVGEDRSTLCKYLQGKKLPKETKPRVSPLHTLKGISLRLLWSRVSLGLAEGMTIILTGNTLLRLGV